MKLKDFLLSYFSSENYEPMRVTELADHFGLEGEVRLEFYDVIDTMLEEETIKMTKRGRIKAYSTEAHAATSHKRAEDDAQDHNFETVEGGTEDIDDAQDVAGEDPMVGHLQANARGFAFFISDVASQDDVFIRHDDLHGALHGDRVRIRIIEPADPSADRNANGEVVDVLSHSREPIVGVYDPQDGYGFVIPDRKEYFKDIYVDAENAMGAEDRDKVIVEILDVDPNEDNPEGRIVEVLGPADAAGVDITAVARQFDLPYEFSAETLQEAEALPEEVDVSEMRHRKDLRKKFTVTIDGPDAKDFDDAISVEQRGKFYNLYVHIADVSHYVKPNSAIDRDAYARGNSVYLLDRVIPMLPEKLSNGICSLNPGVPRLAMTTQMTLDEQGNIVDHQFYESVIESNHRLVYDDVSDYLEHGRIFDDDDELYPALDLMFEIYRLLAAKREARGALDFDFPETAIRLDETGAPIEVGLERRRVANRIIEEFMVLNNVVVGTTFFEKNLPFIYRTHESPKAEDIARLNRALVEFHYEPVEEEPAPARLQAILQKAEGQKEQGVLNMLILQSMTKAEYSPKPIQHYGLAVAHYSHFTSPIRRYSDLIAHRLLKQLLAGAPDQSDEVKKYLAQASAHVSEMEQKAEEAERDVVDMKSAEYMQQFVGETFDGVVTGLTNFGVFIMLENTVEGLAHFRDMTDDYYSYDEEKLVVRGERTHKEVHFGDRVRVLVAAAKPVEREVDFHIEGMTEETAQPQEPENHAKRPHGLYHKRAESKGAKGKRARRKGESRHRNQLSNQTRRKGR
ncbi:MAG: ribonuclease R [Peptoniphilaceae bacterium]|nr:ribonuclease R [Peptoniphilaceae bacterium]MDY6085872.1 ribonuclease R [Peptoniphilaceae bacterium]